MIIASVVFAAWLWAPILDHSQLCDQVTLPL